MNLALPPFAFFPTARLPSTSRQRALWVEPNTQRLQTIDKGAIFAVLQPAGKTLTCVRGSLWITHDGDVKDVVISKGDSYTVVRPDRMLVSGLEASSVTLA